MKYAQAKPLVDKLIDIAILYHASPSLLRAKLYNALDEFLPDSDIKGKRKKKNKLTKEAAAKALLSAMDSGDATQKLQAAQERIDER